MSETFRTQIVIWLREQSVSYSSQARIAKREKIKSVAKAKSDSFEFAAREIEKWPMN